MSEEYQLSMPKEQIERELYNLISDLQVLYHKYFFLRMKVTLTEAQRQVLTCLARHPGITQSEMVDLLCKGRSPIGKSLDSLEAAGWIYRKTSEEDGRIKNVFLTDKLMHLRPQAYQIMTDMDKVAEEGLDEETIEKVKSALEVIRENLRTRMYKS